MPQIEYGPVSPWDAAEVAALHKAYALPAANGAIPYTVEEFALFPECVQVIFTAARCDGKIVGFCLAYNLVIWCYVDILVVHGDYRKMGIARELLRRLEAHKDWRAVEFCHMAESKELAGFAEAAGYKVNGNGWTWRYRCLNGQEEG